MKPVLLLSYDYPPNDGGISRLCSAVAHELHARGRQMGVLTLEAPHIIDTSRPALPTYEVPRAKVWRELATARYLRQLGRDSCVVTGVWNPEATVAMLMGHRDLIVMAHGNEVMPYPQGPAFSFKTFLRRRTLSAARIVVCNSRYTESLVKAIVPGAPTTVITPGVDASRFTVKVNVQISRAKISLPVGKQLILSVSRVDAYKGHDVVLRALAALPNEVRANLHYAVAGKGTHLAELKRLTFQLGLEDMVTWLGFVPDNDLPALYGAADLFILCTREDLHRRGVEGFGMVFLEAQAAGIPVIGTRAGGIPDAIEPGNGGWLIDQDDVGAVQRLLTQLANDTAPFRTQGSLGQRRARTVSTWRHYVDQLLEVVDASPC